MALEKLYENSKNDNNTCFPSHTFSPPPPPILHPLPTKTSLLRSRQAQTLSDATPIIGKIHPFGKINVTFDPVMQF